MLSELQDLSATHTSALQAQKEWSGAQGSAFLVCPQSLLAQVWRKVTPSPKIIC